MSFSPNSFSLRRASGDGANNTRRGSSLGSMEMTHHSALSTAEFNLKVLGMLNPAELSPAALDEAMPALRRLKELTGEVCTMWEEELMRKNGTGGKGPLESIAPTPRRRASGHADLEEIGEDELEQTTLDEHKMTASSDSLRLGASVGADGSIMLSAEDDLTSETLDVVDIIRKPSRPFRPSQPSRKFSRQETEEYDLNTGISYKTSDRSIVSMEIGDADSSNANKGEAGKGGWATEASDDKVSKPPQRGVSRTTVIGVLPGAGGRIGKAQVAPLQTSVAPPDISPLGARRQLPVAAGGGSIGGGRSESPDLSVVAALIEQEDARSIRSKSPEGEGRSAQELTRVDSEERIEKQINTGQATDSLIREGAQAGLMHASDNIGNLEDELGPGKSLPGFDDPNVVEDCVETQRFDSLVDDPASPATANGVSFAPSSPGQADLPRRTDSGKGMKLPSSGLFGISKARKMSINMAKKSSTSESDKKDKKPPPRKTAGMTMNKIKRRLSHKLNNETGDLTQWVPRHHSGNRRRKGLAGPNSSSDFDNFKEKGILARILPAEVYDLILDSRIFVRQTAWPTVRVVAQVYAMVFSPMYPAWNITPGPLMMVGDLFVELFFILDLTLHLFKGVFDPDSQTLIKERNAVFSRWIHSTRFASDVMTCIPFRLIWIICFFATSDGLDLGQGIAQHPNFEALKALNVCQVVKCFPLVMSMIKHTLEGEKPSTVNVIRNGEQNVEEIVGHLLPVAVQRVFRLIYAFFQLIHFLACGYRWLSWQQTYAVTYEWAMWANVDFQGANSTCIKTGVEDGTCMTNILSTKDIFHEWAAAFYWGLCATQGEHIPATTPVENGYMVLVMVFGIIMNACIIGSVASLLAATDTKTALLKQRRDDMSQFMKENNVPFVLSEKVLQYYSYLWSSSSSSNGLWGDLSTSLKTSLNASVMKRCLSKCPLFRDLSSHFIVALSNILTDHLVVLIPGEILFKEGDEGTAMYFVNRGEVTIFKINPKTHAHVAITKIAPGGFFGEVAIVHHTVRAAGAKAKTFCELYVLESHKLDLLLENYPSFKKTIADHIERLKRDRRGSKKLTVPVRPKHMKPKGGRKRASLGQLISESVNKSKKKVDKSGSVSSSGTLLNSSPPGFKRGSVGELARALGISKAAVKGEGAVDVLEKNEADRQEEAREMKRRQEDIERSQRAEEIAEQTGTTPIEPVRRQTYITGIGPNPDVLREREEAKKALEEGKFRNT